MNPQTLARLTGVLFLITYVTSIPALFVFYAPVLKDPGYITGPGPDTSVLVGAFLEVLLTFFHLRRRGSKDRFTKHWRIDAACAPISSATAD